LFAQHATTNRRGQYTQQRIGGDQVRDVAGSLLDGGDRVRRRHAVGNFIAQAVQDKIVVFDEDPGAGEIWDAQRIEQEGLKTLDVHEDSGTGGVRENFLKCVGGAEAAQAEVGGRTPLAAINSLQAARAAGSASKAMIRSHQPATAAPTA